MNAGWDLGGFYEQVFIGFFSLSLLDFRLILPLCMAVIRYL